MAKLLKERLELSDARVLLFHDSALASQHLVLAGDDGLHLLFHLVNHGLVLRQSSGCFALLAAEHFHLAVCILERLSQLAAFRNDAFGQLTLQIRD